MPPTFRYFFIEVHTFINFPICIHLWNHMNHPQGFLGPLCNLSLSFHLLHIPHSKFPGNHWFIFLLYISLYFLFLYTWNQSVYFLTSFTQHKYFEIHLFCCLCYQFVPFVGELYSIVWLCNNLLIHSLVDGNLGCFKFLPWFIKLLYVDICFHFLGKYPEVEWLGHMFNFLRNCQKFSKALTLPWIESKGKQNNIFQSSCTILHSHQQAMTVLVPPHHPQPLVWAKNLWDLGFFLLEFINTVIYNLTLCTWTNHFTAVSVFLCKVKGLDSKIVFLIIVFISVTFKKFQIYFWVDNTFFWFKTKDTNDYNENSPTSVPQLQFPLPKGNQCYQLSFYRYGMLSHSFFRYIAIYFISVPQFI